MNINRSAFLLLVFTLSVWADGPIGPVIDDRALQAERAAFARAKEAARIRHEYEQAALAQQTALAQARRIAQARALEEAKALERSRQLDQVERDRLARERQGEAVLRSREDREALNKLMEEWREVNGTTQNMAWAGWVPIRGGVRDSHDGWMRVTTVAGDICLTNFPVALADGEKLQVQATDVGLHKLHTQLGTAANATSATLRKYDCGRPCPPPATWLASAALRTAEEDRLRAEEDARITALKDAYRADLQRLAAAEAAEVEKGKEAERQKLAALQAKQDATTRRVIAYQHQQASNGLGSFQYEVGKRYLFGDGVLQNKRTATHWLSSACTNRLSEATNLLAEVDRVGELVTDSK